MSILVEHELLKHKFGDIKEAILDSQAPQFLKLDGSRAMTGNLDLTTAYKLCFGQTINDVLLKRYGNKNLGLRLGDDSAFGNLYINVLHAVAFRANQIDFYIDTKSHNDAYTLFRSYLNGYVEVAKCYQDQFQISKGKLMGDLDVNANNIGPLLIDRTTATKYRLYVDNGVLSIEAV